jgi:tetratricopeptide (TPR) repeat protein
MNVHPRSTSDQRFQADLLRAKARSLRAWRNISGAEEALRLAIITDPTCSEAYYDLAWINGEGQGGSREIIIPLLEEAVNQRPDNIVAIRFLCLHLFGQKQYDRVIELAEKTMGLSILQEEPFDVLVGLFLRLLEKAYQRKGDIDGAARAKMRLDEQLSTHKCGRGTESTKEGHAEQADLAVKAGDIHGAIQVLRRGILEKASLYPLEVALWERLAKAYLACGKDREGLACFLMLEDDSPFRAATANKLMTISGLYRKLGDETAAEYYSQLFVRSATL